MPRVAANGIALETEVHGGLAAGRPLVLIRGLGTQMVQWAPGFLDALVARGHAVVIFDNRDVGRSTWFDEAGVPALSDVVAAVAAGTPPPVPYTLEDMADDIAGLLGAHGLETAHIVGMSMGGMLTTVFGARHPDRVRSLVPIMASTGNPALPPPTPAAMEALMSPSPSERAAYIAHHVRTAKVLASPAYPVPDEARAELAARVFDRAFHPQGVARQYAAIVASGDRRAQLATITAPTLVIHGADDPLVRVEGGRDIAATIPGADWLEVPGMGHDLPPGLFELLADAITGHTEKAESAR